MVAPVFDTPWRHGSGWPAFRLARRTVRTPPKTFVLVNPAAGRGRALRAQPHVADYLRLQGHAAEFAQSQSAEDFERRAAEAAAAGYERIVALGGDGTFQSLVRATLGAPVALGFFPAGGGNDIAAALGIPKDPVAAAYVFLRSQPRSMDVVRARFAEKTRIYIGGGGLGLDAEAARLANGKFQRLPGAARYVASALWALVNFQAFHLEGELDGKRVLRASDPLMIAAVSNTPSYGAGIKIAPAAEIDDGLLDITLVAQMSWMRLVEAIPPILQTGNLRWPEIRRFRASRVILRVDRPEMFHGDGELLGELSPGMSLEIENLPGAIRVVAPARR